MPGFDGTGPQGTGPLTGRGLGYCILRESGGSPGQTEGWAGIDGLPVANANIDMAERKKEVTEMPFGDGTGPAGMGPMTGRATGFGAGFPMPGYRNPGSVRGYMASYNPPPSSYGPRYGVPYTGWLSRWFRRGFGLARGFRFGRARFGYRW